MSYLSSFTNRENIGLEQFKWLPESKYHLLEAHLYLLIVKGITGTNHWKLKSDKFK